MSGDFNKMTALESDIPKRKLQVFVSSTFTDTHLERNVLLKEINPIVSKFHTIFANLKH